MQVIDISALLDFPPHEMRLNDFSRHASDAEGRNEFKNEYSFREWRKVFPPPLARHSKSEKLYCRALTSSTFICSEKFMKNSSRFVSANKALHRMLLPLLAVSESINSVGEVIWIRGNVSKISLRTFQLSPRFLRRQGLPMHTSS